MSGKAQKIFQERYGCQEIDSKVSKWPLLEKFLSNQCLGYVDLALANQLLTSRDADESMAALICHLSMGARQGHLCVALENGLIKPSPKDVWVSDETSNPIEDDYDRLEELIICGADQFDATIQNLSPIIKNNTSFYLQRYWQLESIFLKVLKEKFLENPSLLPIDHHKIEQKVNELIQEEKLLKEQAQAIMMVSSVSLGIITGGPGTGKTYTAGMLLRILWEALSSEMKSKFTIVLAAPTGKAAANLEASIRKAVEGIDGFPVLKAQTLHQLLKIKQRGTQHDQIVLSADLILVDESSMIDIKLMGQLFSSVKPGARLVLLGDRHQLPSVEAGSIFADLTQYFIQHADSNHMVELKTCLRAELECIIDLADHIKSKDEDTTLQLLTSGSQGVRFVHLDEKLGVHEQQKKLIDYSISNLPVINTDPLELLAQFNRFRVLTPLRKGPFGVDALNALIFQEMKKTQGDGLIVPIMVMQNDYRLGLFNGEMGLIIKEGDREFALFASREPGMQWRKIPTLLMPRYEYAYCLSIHKSQGSEFDHVVMLLPDGAQTFGKEALYTGVTRAKKCLEIWSEPLILSRMIKYASVRNSGVIERLSDCLSESKNNKDRQDRLRRQDR